MTVIARRKSRPPKSAKPGPIVKIQGENASLDGPAAKKAFGSSSDDFIHGLVRQIVNIASQGKTPDDENIAFVSAIIGGIKPTDQIEAMLGAQMAAVHNATMTFARRLAHCETIPQQDSAERAFNKLARTFAAQVEALKRYRTGGHQHVTVKHVTVNEGGQAIVGNVAKGG